MSVKLFEVAGLGTVRLQKRRGTRHLRLSLGANGDIRVSLPAWVPYRLGLEFVQNKHDWIIKHRTQPSLLVDRQVIGKAHRLEFVATSRNSRPSSRIAGNLVRVTYPVSYQPADKTVQATARRGATKALQTEAEALLPDRLQALARKYGFQYRGLRLKHLRSKWGSCDQQTVITLNVFLMTLPWELIDYVMLHELVHTKVLRHGPPFWQEMAVHTPNTQQLRKRLRTYQPTFHSS